MADKSMDKIVNLCKSRGYIYPGSEIYGGLSNSWDYGPLGAEMKKNIKDMWWRKFIKESKYNVGIDAAIIMNPQVWVTTGHVGGFSDPLIDCKECKTRHRAQMELEFFCKPGTDLEWYEYWKNFCKDWLVSIGIKEENLRMREHSKEELSFYSKGTTDIEYLFPFGWGELWGIADRTDYDLSRHMEASKEDLTYLDPETNEKYVPYCVEPAVGVDRIFLTVLCDAYDEEEVGEGDVRTVLHLHPSMAPVKVAVLPLSKKLSSKAEEVFERLSKKYMCEYDEAGSIGKRYRREDEIGTPYCVTVDFDTETDNSVTIRDRDTMEQVRVNIDELEKWLDEKIK